MPTTSVSSPMPQLCAACALAHALPPHDPSPSAVLSGLCQPSHPAHPGATGHAPSGALLGVGALCASILWKGKPTKKRSKSTISLSETNLRPNCGLFTLHYVFCLGREVLGMGKGCVTKHVNKHVAATQCPFEHTEAMFVCVCIHVCVHMCESVCVCEHLACHSSMSRNPAHLNHPGANPKKQQWLQIGKVMPAFKRVCAGPAEM